MSEEGVHIIHMQ